MKNQALLILILLPAALLSQEKTNSNYKELKIYVLTEYVSPTYRNSIYMYDNTYDGKTYNADDKNINTGKMSIAITKKLNSNRSYEWELMPVYFNCYDYKTRLIDSIINPENYITGGERVFNIQSYLRFQYNYGLTKNETAKLKPYIGASARYFVDYYISKPHTALFFPTNELNTGFTLSVVPALKWDINEKVFLDFNIPFDLLDAYFTREQVGNPSISEENRVNTSITFKELPKRYNFRIGVGIKL